MRELLLGCGRSRAKRMAVGNAQWHDLTTIDIYPECSPDIVWDLDITPWPLESDTYDEVHAYEVLEHLGRQGDYVSFFAHFSEIWRVLKPGGRLYASCPAITSPWLWGDPGHRRVISAESFVFLDQQQYTLQQGETAMTDYRNIYHADLVPVLMRTEGHNFVFVLEARK